MQFFLPERLGRLSRLLSLPALASLPKDPRLDSLGVRRTGTPCPPSVYEPVSTQPGACHFGEG